MRTEPISRTPSQATAWPKTDSLATILVVTALLASFASVAGAQTAELPRFTQAVDWISPSFDGGTILPGPDDPVPFGGERGEKLAYGPVYQRSFSSPGAPWIQLEFGAVSLGRYSYLEVVSHSDGAVQRLNAATMAQWRNRSAYFNGDGVTVRLYVLGRDQDVQFGVDRMVVGRNLSPSKSICGSTDDRTASTEPRVGRIDPIGCTGWVADNGTLLTAGHCLDGPGNDILSFNPPASLSNGAVQFPGPEDQYSIDATSFDFADGGVGNDWGVFEVFDNSVTGLQPLAAQGGFPIRQDLSLGTIRITGFGVDSGTTNQTNQTHTGPDASSSGNTLRYRADTRPGNSGSPVVEVATGDAVGIHTHGGCTSSGGSNKGTSFFRSELWMAASTTFTPPEFPVATTGRTQLTLDEDGYAICALGGVDPNSSTGYCYVNNDGDDDTWELIVDNASCNFMCLPSAEACPSTSVREILLTGTSDYVLDDSTYSYCATGGANPGGSNGYCYVNHDRDDDTWELFANNASWCNFMCVRSGCPEISSHREILLAGNSTFDLSNNDYLYCAIGGAIPNGACDVDFQGNNWRLISTNSTFCNFMCIRR